MKGIVAIALLLVVGLTACSGATNDAPEVDAGADDVLIQDQEFEELEAALEEMDSLDEEITFDGLEDLDSDLDSI